MATLKDLCTAIPQDVLQEQERYERQQAMRELNRRKALSYAQRMQDLQDTWHIYDKCKQSRPQKGKYRNTASREEAGTIARVTMGVRTGKYSVCVCSVKQLR